MRIQLDRIREEAFEWSEELEIAPERLGQDEVVSLGPVTWKGRVEALDEAFLMRAHLDYDQGLCCDRCLGTAGERVDTSVELMIFPRSPEPLPEEQELDDDDVSVLYLDGEELDVEPILLEQMQLNVPMKPLCRSDCAGLCAQCGADLNDGACDCDTAEVDPRWAGLAQLIQTDAESKDD